MKRYTQITITLLITGLMASCAGPGYIRAEAVSAPMRRVMQRHDGYVRADSTLTELQRRTRLRTTELLGRVLQEAEK